MRISSYLKTLSKALFRTQVTERGGLKLGLDSAVERSVKMVHKVRRASSTLMLVGNGGSAAIASHQAMDFSRMAGVRAIAFNDAVGLTCLGNDFGYENVFAKPVERFAKKGDLLLAISSSGRSPNILQAAESARRAGCSIITFTGFKPDNPLRRLGDLNFYVASNEYGKVEVSHLALIHAISDFTARRNGNKSS